jgi:serine/threonine protein kinase
MITNETPRTIIGAPLQMLSSRGGGRFGRRGSGTSRVDPALLFRIRKQDIEVKKMIGAGSFCDVLQGRWKATDVAVKRLRAALDQQVMESFGSEVAVMAQLRHPNICMMLGTCYHPPMIVLELCTRGSLYQLLHLQKLPMDWSLLFKFMLEAANGMAYLHQQRPPIIHHDLKSLNVLITSHWGSKVADFGLAKLKRGAGQGRNASQESIPGDHGRRNHSAESGGEKGGRLGEGRAGRAGAGAGGRQDIGSGRSSSPLVGGRGLRYDSNGRAGSKDGSVKRLPHRDRDGPKHPVPHPGLPDSCSNLAEKVRDLKRNSPVPSTRTLGGSNSASASAGGSKQDDAGSLPWSAPEIFEEQSITEKVDVYAYGCMLYEVLAKQVPFGMVDGHAIQHLVSSGKRPTDLNVINLDHRFDGIVKLMIDCWDQSPAKRPDFMDVSSRLDEFCKAFFGSDEWQECVIFPTIGEDQEGGKGKKVRGAANACGRRQCSGIGCGCTAARVPASALANSVPSPPPCAHPNPPAAPAAPPPATQRPPPSPPSSPSPPCAGAPGLQPLLHRRGGPAHGLQDRRRLVRRRLLRQVLRYAGGDQEDAREHGDADHAHGVSQGVRHHAADAPPEPRAVHGLVHGPGARAAAAGDGADGAGLALRHLPRPEAAGGAGGALPAGGQVRD